MYNAKLANIIKIEKMGQIPKILVINEIIGSAITNKMLTNPNVIASCHGPFTVIMSFPSFLFWSALSFLRPAIAHNVCFANG
jgi:hypothetical protein